MPKSLFPAASPETRAQLEQDPTLKIINDNAYAEFACSRHPYIFGLPATQAWPEIADFNRHKIAMGLRGGSLILRDQELVLNRHGRPEWELDAE